MHRALGFTIFLFFLSLALHGQGNRVKAPLFKEKGFTVGYGRGIDSFNIPEGRYNVVFLIAHFGIDLLRNRSTKKNNPGIFTLYFEPQVNPVFIEKPGGTVKDLEFGMNIGFKHMYPLTKNVFAYILIATGPHYITAHTTKESRGFIFSDNLGTGVYIFVSKNTALTLGFKLRHISNGDTRMPNMGINTFNYHVGLSKLIR